MISLFLFFLWDRIIVSQKISHEIGEEVISDFFWLLSFILLLPVLHLLCRACSHLFLLTFYLANNRFDLRMHLEISSWISLRGCLSHYFSELSYFLNFWLSLRVSLGDDFSHFSLLLNFVEGNGFVVINVLFESLLECFVFLSEFGEFISWLTITVFIVFCADSNI